jgi:PAS domain S-box-containing protein
MTASSFSLGERPDGARTRPPRARRPHAHDHSHAVQFYEDDAFLAATVGDFVAEGLAVGQPAIVIATKRHREAFAAHLSRSGVDIDAARKSGLLTELDARETLATFMNGAMPDERRFQTVIGSRIEKSLQAGRHPTVRAYGEMVDVLWADGNAAAAISLEDLWNQLGSSHGFSLLCAYSLRSFAAAEHATDFRAICDLHTQVIPTEHYTEGEDDARLREITLLQQRAQALATEVQRRAELERQLVATVATLREREEELKDVLENAAEGIHLVGVDGTIKWANHAELEMLGYSAQEYIGHHIAEFHVDRPIIEQMLARLARGETLHDISARLRCKDGSIRHVLVSSNVLWREGDFVHTRCFTRDVTALQRASAEREQLLERERTARAEAERAKAIAEQANRAKSEFLAVMSHELRTPLNAIGGYAELMELGIKGPVSAQQREVLERIQRSQRHLLGLINQVLNYARVETGNVRYELTDIALDELLRTSDALVLPQMQAKGLKYSYRACEPAVRVRADSEKLQQIMLNLLANAAKFTDRGGEIRVECGINDAGVLVHVTDTGIGIPTDKLQSIFDPFVQVDPNYTRTRDGVGLGLAISRDLARGMGGDLYAKSTLGEGSTFTLTLPRTP